jgi:hypothetical protein
VNNLTQSALNAGDCDISIHFMFKGGVSSWQRYLSKFNVLGSLTAPKEQTRLDDGQKSVRIEKSSYPHQSNLGSTLDSPAY